MRVLVSCLQGLKHHSLPAYDFWRPYFLHGLREAGHDVLEVPDVDWAEGLTYSRGRELDDWRARTWDATLIYVRREMLRGPIHLFLSYLFPMQIEVAAVRELQRIGIPCVNFFCDSVREFRAVPQEFSPFALHWLPDFEALPLYRKAGLPHMQAPYPCWIAPEFRNVPDVETEPPTFIGSVDVLRRALFGRAIDLGADLVLRGAGWQTSDRAELSKRRSIRKTVVNQLESIRRDGLGGLGVKFDNQLRPVALPPIPGARVKSSVSNAEYFRITREAAVTIGVNRVPTTKAPNRRPLLFSRLRDVEAPMLGACYLTEWTEGVEKMYELGAEVETYRTPEELSAKLAELKQDSSRRRAMRERAQRRALHEHALGRSVARIAARLGMTEGSRSAI
jgi:Glycosyl transferases group 1